MATLPRPMEVTPWTTIRPRTLLSGILPLQPPEEFLDPSSYPSLPSSCKLSATALPSYRCSIHLFPAAYPRAPSRLFPPPAPVGRKLSKSEIKETMELLSARKEEAEKLRTTVEAETALAAEGRQEVLWMVAKRYKRIRPATKLDGEPLTLIALHGIGFSKEVRGVKVRCLLAFTDVFSELGTHLLDHQSPYFQLQLPRAYRRDLGCRLRESWRLQLPE